MTHKKKEEEVEAARKRLKRAVFTAYILLCAFIVFCCVFVIVKYGSAYFTILCLSCFLPVFLAAVWASWREMKSIRYEDAEDTHNQLGLFGTTGLVLLSVLIMHGTMAVYIKYHPEEKKDESSDSEESETAEIKWVEAIAESFDESFQTFSLDAQFSDAVSQGKKMVYDLIDEQYEAERDTWAKVIGVYIAAQNVLAPVLGGAIILELISSFVPSVRAFLWGVLFFRKQKYYFSQLDERSLALAKSIYKDPKRKSPVIVFMKTSGKDEEEKKELIKRARAVRAICLESDIRNYCPWYVLKKQYVLMDEDPAVNLTVFAGLIKRENLRCLKNSSINLIYLDDCFLTEEHMIFFVRQEESI